MYLLNITKNTLSCIHLLTYTCCIIDVSLALDVEVAWISDTYRFTHASLDTLYSSVFAFMLLVLQKSPK